MLNLIARHSFVVILLAVLLEELGIPMPIPTDLLIVFAGAMGGRSPLLLALWFGLLSLASVLGASGLFLIVRRGGRPLVERFGRYVHLGPQQLARAEATLHRSGWLGIAVGRAIPGLRYATVIACGLLDVSYWRFVSAHLAGSSLYIITFLGLGAAFGPAVLERLHPSHQLLRMLWLLALAIGLPLLLWWCARRGYVAPRVAPSRRRMFGAMLLASLAGASTLAATWAAALTIADLLGLNRAVVTVYALAGRWIGRSPGSSMLTYLAVLALAVLIGVLYQEVLLPRLPSRPRPLWTHTLGLLLLGSVGGNLVFIALLLSERGMLARWSSGGILCALLAILAGMTSYAVTTVAAQELAVVLLPTARPRPASVAPPERSAEVGISDS